MILAALGVRDLKAEGGIDVNLNSPGKGGGLRASASGDFEIFKISSLNAHGAGRKPCAVFAQGSEESVNGGKNDESSARGPGNGHTFRCPRTCGSR